MNTRKGLPVLAILLTGFLLIFGTVARASQATELLLNKARSLEGRGLTDLAAHSWEQVLLADPNNPEALAGLARYAKTAGKKAEADRYLQRLRAVDPQNAAISRIDAMHSLDQQRGLLDEAQRLAQKQDFDGALRIYRQVFNNEPPPGSWAIAYYETQAATAGGWEDATGALQRLVAKYPGSPEYTLALGKLLTYRPKTRLQGMQLLESTKGDAAVVNKARTAWRQALVWDAGNAASLPSLQSYLGRYPDSELAKLMNGNGKGKAPQPSQSPEQALNGTREGAAYQALRSGKLKDAEQQFSTVLKSSPRDGNSLAGLGFVRMKEQDFSAAVPLFQQALAAQPKNKSVSTALETARFWEHMKRGGDAVNGARLSEASEEFKAALRLRPQSVEATRSLAGSYEAQQRPVLAIPLYRNLVQSDSVRSEDWFGLVRSQFNAGDAHAALKSLNQVPVKIQNVWTEDADHLAVLAFVQADAGDQQGAYNAAKKIEQLVSNRGITVSSGTQRQLAGLYLRLHQPLRAAAAFDQLARADSNNVEDWAGLIGALSQSGEAEEAQSALERMPRNAYQSAMRRSDFLRSLAGLQVVLKHYDRAEIYLQKAIEIDQAAGKKPELETQLQVADVWSHAGKSGEAERMLRSVLEQQPNSASAWTSLLSLLHSEKRDKEAMDLLQTIPEPVFTSLNGDYTWSALKAQIYSGTGRYREAMNTVRSAIARAETEGTRIPADLLLQQAWILLNGRGNERELSTVLSRLNSNSDLTASQTKDVDSIWSIWSQRQAGAAMDRGDISGAVRILRTAVQAFPEDSQMKATLAGAYLKGGDTKDAFLMYQGWGLKGATAEDFSGAIGSAMAVQDAETAQRWLARGLRRYPRDPKLLSLAGKQAAQQGNYDKARIYLREALASVSSDNSSALSASARANPAGNKQSLAALLAGDDDENSVSLPDASAESIAADGGIRSRRDRSLVADSRMDPLNRGSEPYLNSNESSARAFNGGNSFATPMNDIAMSDAREIPFTRSDRARTKPTDTLARPADDLVTEALNRMPSERLSQTSPLLGATAAASNSGQQTLQEQINNELGAINSRNSPYFTNGMVFQSRTGEAGVDKLVTEEAHIEASTTVSDRVRLSLIAKPTYLDSGSPDTTNTLGFGTVAKNGASAQQTAFGIAAEGQLATRDFGLRLGMSPNDFLVRNWVGGLRFNPGHGPFTILLNRDAVRDTKLSFAGERDSSTNQVWGGVIANAGSVLGNWGTDKSGFYTNLGYQDIRGKSVAPNSRVDLTMGAYFKILTTKQGTLTAGLNLSGMHYDKNLRYFTLGQGGYFSPQQYILANVPLRWSGTWNRVLQYSISASLGVQHFQEDASPYFPTSTFLQSSKGGMYSALASTGGNYNLDFRMAYQLTPQWLAGAFASVGNARDYRNASAGIFLKYLFQPRPFVSEINAESVPDWKGAQPFGLPLN